MKFWYKLQCSQTLKILCLAKEVRYKGYIFHTQKVIQREPLSFLFTNLFLTARICGVTNTFLFKKTCQHMHVPACMCVCVCYMYEVPVEVSRRHWVSRSWSCKWL